MGFWDWKYTASDIADWFDQEDEKHWREHDEWLIESNKLGDASPVLLFAHWAADRVTTSPLRIRDEVIKGTITDVLRIGNDIDLNSAGGIAKGVFLNLMRVVAVVGGAETGANIVAKETRYAGVLATSKLKNIENALGPCCYVAINNVLSYMRGRTIQLFGVVEDIIRVGGANKPGTRIRTLLDNEEVKSALAKYGVTWRELNGMNTIEDVLCKAQTADGPIVFGIRVPNAPVGHRLTAVKDVDGSVRILDYVDQSVEAFKGYASWAEYVAARPRYANVVLNPPFIGFSSRYLKVLQFGDGTFRFGLPVALGMKWNGEAEDKPSDIARSVWRYLKGKLKDSAPSPPTASAPPTPSDSAEPIPSDPAHDGNGLGVNPLPPEAANAPKLHLLTGVQHRLKYMGYYKGAVNGSNDPATKNGVIAFQKDWFQDPGDWDGIPGPRTQAMIYSVLGW